MNPKASEPDGRSKARASVEFAQYKLILDAAVPNWGIRERILKSARALIPAKVAGPYRQFWEAEVALIVESPDLYEPFQKRYKDVESEMVAAAQEKTPRERDRVVRFIRETGPVRLLEELWPPLIDLRYEYFTLSALKILQRADLYKKHGPIFEGDPILIQAFHYAVTMDDLNFFARVGDVLRKRQENLESMMSNLTPSNLQRFLLRHWADQVDGVPPLCDLNISQLTAVCASQLRNDSLTEDCVDKTKQRLGLRSNCSKSRQ
jgi:hypothetical protein